MNRKVIRLTPSHVAGGSSFSERRKITVAAHSALHAFVCRRLSAVPSSSCNCMSTIGLAREEHRTPCVTNPRRNGQTLINRTSEANESCLDVYLFERWNECCLNVWTIKHNNKTASRKAKKPKIYTLVKTLTPLQYKGYLRDAGEVCSKQFSYGAHARVIDTSLCFWRLPSQTQPLLLRDVMNTCTSFDARDER